MAVFSSLCCNSNPHGAALLTAGNTCQQLAMETTALCEDARGQGEMAQRVSRNVQDSLTAVGENNNTRGGGGGGIANAPTFVEIQKLIQDGKAKQTILMATNEMSDLATTILNKSRDMTEAMTLGIKSLPDPLKEELEEEEELETDDEETVVATNLQEVDEHVEELDTCTRSLSTLNLFTAATSGKKAFEGLASKETVCLTLFQKIREFAVAVSSISLALSGGGCCSKIKSVKEFFHCLRLSQLMTKVAEAVQRLIKSMIRFIKTAWKRIEGFLEEFDAARTIGRFTKYSKLGKTPPSFMETIMPEGTAAICCM